MKLPESIAAYFAAANAFDPSAAAAQFTADAHVHDENHDHHGRDAVQAWVADSSQKFRPQIENLSVESRDGDVIAVNRISGEFPGSPIELTFSFTLRDGQIARLNIG